MVESVLKEAENKMQKTIEVMREDFQTIRAGKASPSILDKIEVEYYGAVTPINQLANISAPEPRLIVIQPWDKGSMGEIERAISKSDLGLNPTNDGALIRIAIPMLTEERRKELVKTVKKKTEEVRVALRNIRRDFNSTVKNMVKNNEISEDESNDTLEDIQTLTDNYIQKAEEVMKNKEAEIMEV